LSFGFPKETFIHFEKIHLQSIFRSHHQLERSA